MTYINPKTVFTPRKHIKSVDVLYDGGEDSWSIALLEYDNKERIGIRWNGGSELPVGNPQSRGKPTWFAVPEELAAGLRESAEQLSNSQEGGLLSGYRAMAADNEREAEAQEWCEGIIGDAIHQEG